MSASEESKEKLKQDVAKSVQKGVQEGLRGRAQTQSVGDPGSNEAVGLASISGELMPDFVPEADVKLSNMENRLIKFAENANRIIKNNVVDAFVGLGQVIGNALSGSGNVLKSVTQLVLGTMGNLLQQLGQQAIVLGLTLEGVKKALLSFGGLGAIAIGTVAVALGKAFSNKAQSLGSSLGGGASGSTGASAGGNGVSSSFNQSFSADGRDEILLRARGRDLVAVLNAQENFNNAIG